MTPKDRELLALLRLNAREPVSSLARKLGVSRSTVQDRLRRLEAAGVVSGYTVQISEDHAADGVRAFVTIAIEPRRSAEVVSSLKRVAALDSVHSVAGKFDFVALARTASPAEMENVLDDIGRVPGVVRTESAIILSTKLDRR
jgi:DNA-binding Lrp family transcriptional regulator